MIGVATRARRDVFSEVIHSDAAVVNDYFEETQHYHYSSLVCSVPASQTRNRHHNPSFFRAHHDILNRRVSHDYSTVGCLAYRLSVVVRMADRIDVSTDPMTVFRSIAFSHGKVVDGVARQPIPTDGLASGRLVASLEARSQRHSQSGRALEVQGIPAGPRCSEEAAEEELECYHGKVLAGWYASREVVLADAKPIA